MSLTKLEKRKTCKIKKGIEYFEKKYKGKELTITIEDEDIVVFGNRWYNHNIGNPAIFEFLMRTMRTMGQEMKPAYYGKVMSLGELVYPEELEEI